MAKQYVVTETEMLALIDQLKLTAMQDVGHFRNWQEPKEWGDKPPQLADMHRAFHYVVVRWVQEMGFSGLRS
jgi:hypothetical protein